MITLGDGDLFLDVFKLLLGGAERGLGVVDFWGVDSGLGGKVGVFFAVEEDD